MSTPRCRPGSRCGRVSDRFLRGRRLPEHDPIAEGVVETLACIAGFGEPGQLQSIRRELAHAGGAQERIPGVIRQAYSELAEGVVREAAFFQVCAGGGAFDWIPEEVFEEGAGGGLGVVKHLPLACLGGGGAVFGQIDAGAVGELAEGIDEFDAVTLDDKVDGIAAGFAAKTMEELAGRTDVERGAFFCMEGAEADEVFSAPFQGDGLPDELDDVDGSEDKRFVIAGAIERCHARLSAAELGYKSRADTNLQILQGC